MVLSGGVTCTVSLYFSAAEDETAYMHKSTARLYMRDLHTSLTTLSPKKNTFCSVRIGSKGAGVRCFVTVVASGLWMAFYACWGVMSRKIIEGWCAVAKKGGILLANPNQ
jgi:hypothetical protein